MANSPKTGRAPATRRTQADRSETTQRRILNSAVRLLQREGYQNTNLQKIAQGARVTLGALQHHFGNRETLMERVVDEVMAPLAHSGAAWPQDAQALALPERARAFVQSAWDSTYGLPRYVAAWSLYFGCRSSATLFRRIDAQRAREDPLYFAHFLALFPEIAERHPKPQDVASLVFSSLRGIAVMRIFETDAAATAGQLDALAHLITLAGSTPASPPSALR